MTDAFESCHWWPPQECEERLQWHKLNSLRDFLCDSDESSVGQLTPSRVKVCRNLQQFFDNDEEDETMAGSQLFVPFPRPVVSPLCSPPGKKRRLAEQHSPPTDDEDEERHKSPERTCNGSIIH